MKILKSKLWFCLIVLFFILAIISNSCLELSKPQPIPKEKEAIIGIWESSLGFKIEIKPEGIATILLHG